MAFTVLADGSIKTDSLAEAMELARALREQTPATVRNTARAPAPLDLDLDEPAEESSLPPMFPSWQTDAPTLGEGRPAPRALPPPVISPRPASPDLHPLHRLQDLAAPAAPAAGPPAKHPKGSPEYRTQISESLRCMWARRREQVAAGLASPLQMPDMAPVLAAQRARYLRDPGKGSIRERDGKFHLVTCWKGRPVYQGVFATRELAEDVARQIREARQRGEEPPTFVTKRSGGMSETARENMRTAMTASWARRRGVADGSAPEPPPVAPAPAQPPPAPAPAKHPKGSPAYRAQVADGCAGTGPRSARRRDCPRSIPSRGWRKPRQRRRGVPNIAPTSPPACAPAGRADAPRRPPPRQRCRARRSTRETRRRHATRRQPRRRPGSAAPKARGPTGRGGVRTTASLRSPPVPKPRGLIRGRKTGTPRRRPDQRTRLKEAQ